MAYSRTVSGNGNGADGVMGFILLSMALHGAIVLVLVLQPSWPKPLVQKELAPISVALIAPPPPPKPAAPQVKPAPEPAVKRVRSAPKKAVVAKPAAPVAKQAAKKPQPVTDAIPVKRRAARKPMQKQAPDTNRKLIASALQDLEKQVETDRPQSLKEEIEKMKAAVASGEKTASSAEKKGMGVAKRAELARMENVYMHQIAHAVQQNWAYAGPVEGAGGFVLVVFKIAPDGRVRGLSVMESSGNRLLEDSARRAILKSEPLPPQPAAIRKEFVELGLRFTIDGVEM